MSASPPTTTATAISMRAWPRWVQEVVRSLAVRPHIVLSGNIHDQFFVPTDNDGTLLPLQDCLLRVLRPLGYDGLFVYDRSEGVTILPDDSELRRRVAAMTEMTELTFQTGATPIARPRLIEVARRLVASTNPRLALVIEYASRLVQRPADLFPEELEMFAAFEKLAYSSHALVGANRRAALFNPIVWVVSAEKDLPHWFVGGNERVWTHPIPRPDYDARERVAARLLGSMPDFAQLEPAQKAELVDGFADQPAGLTLTSMISIFQLAMAEGLPASDIDEAVLRFKIGVADNPWRREHILDRVRRAEEAISARVKGQTAAIVKTVDILKRSITGLTGAHTSGRSGRPKGVLFLAGPTGVGKTELAKALTECLFSDERAYIRFDMSEFAAEHSDARLLGAPPGYIGFDAGGELTKAIRERPFSVVLFDEIEKAHPRILDKFLQLLEDGRLTDGSGQTAYFSEAVVVFTSNLGIWVRGEDGRLHENTKPGTPYEEVEYRVRTAIEHHFKAVLGRPELLNRIGDNIVVFNFIEPPVANQIFEMMLSNILRRVKDQQDVELRIDDPLRDQLRAACTADLSNGGRGIGNALETRFVNPLARALFDRGPSTGTELRVTGFEANAGVYTVHLA